MRRPYFTLREQTPLAMLVSLSILFLALSSAFADGADPRTLLFLGNRNIAPVVYSSGETAAGVAVDIVQALAGHLRQPVIIRAMDWVEAQALVARGEADALIQINQTEERRKIYDFSDPLLESQFSIFIRADQVGVSGLSGLRGKRVGVEAGGLPQQILENQSRITLTVIASFQEGFQTLQEGGIDAVVVDYRVGSYVLAENNIRNVKATGEPIAFSYSSFAVRKGNSELLDAINQALRTIKADGTYASILDKWKPKEGVFQTREQITRTIYNAMIPALIALFLTTVVWIAVLKRGLKKKKAAEGRLREQYSTLRSIIESAGALIFSVDRQYRYTSFNQGHAGTMKAIYGARIELGRSILEYMTVAEDRETARHNLDRALAGEQIVEEAYSGAEPLSRQYFRVSHSPIKEGEDILGVAVLAQDMTERRRAEEEARTLNQELDRRVRERTAQLEAANKELEAFAYSVSHDLRTPLRSIDGFSQALLDDYRGRLDDEGIHYLHRVRAAAQRMARLIDDLLSLSRLTRGAMRMEKVDLSRLARGIADELAGREPGRRVAFSIVSEATVTGDARFLRIALENLFDNAWKFTRRNAEATIEFGMDRTEEGPAYFVRDNGAGFDMEYADRLFAAFQRLHTTEEFPGTGIGLATVQRIIRRHGGRVWAEGDVGKGATFHFTVP